MRVVESDKAPLRFWRPRKARDSTYRAVSAPPGAKREPASWGHTGPQNHTNTPDLKTLGETLLNQKLPLRSLKEGANGHPYAAGPITCEKCCNTKPVPGGIKMLWARRAFWLGKRVTSPKESGGGFGGRITESSA